MFQIANNFDQHVNEKNILRARSTDILRLRDFFLNF